MTNLVGKKNELIKSLADDIYNCSQTRHGGFVTVLVGAGASRSSPTVAQLKEALIPKQSKAFRANTLVHFKKEPKKCTLEELFSIHEKLHGKNAVTDFLRNYSPDTPNNNAKLLRAKYDNIKPTPGYEFMAHLVHHGLINHIITTNFDEEIEASLNDEIGPENFELIKNKSDFDHYRIGVGIYGSPFEDKKPGLFKIHGTISYPLTIRTTIEKVHKFEDEKFDVLKFVLQRTNILIIVGYSFFDTDFKNVFLAALKNRMSTQPIRIYWVTRTSSGKTTYKSKAFDLIRKEIEAKQKGRIIFIEMGQRIGMNQQLAGSDEFFEKLATFIGAGPNKSIPTLARHKIRNITLQHLNLSEIRRNKFLLDLVIFAIKSKGLFCLDALTDCPRIKRYCKDLREGDPTISPNNLLNLLKNAELIREDTEKQGLYYVPVLGDKIEMEIISKKISGLFNSSFDTKKLTKELEKLLETFDVDILKPDESEYLMFDNPESILNHRDWDEKTKSLVETADNKLMIIAQTGEWITRAPAMFKVFLEKPSVIQLITCKKIPDPTVQMSSTYSSETSNSMHNIRQKKVENDLKRIVAGTGGTIEIKYLPWEMLSEHMKLGNKKGMYMRRIAKSPNVSPVWLVGENCKILSEMFEHYWKEATQGPIFN